MKTQMTKTAMERKLLANPKAGAHRVRAWILRTHPEEKPMIGDFSKTITFAEVAKRMLAGENFYDICSCTDSVQREYCFAKLADLYGTDYDFWYYCWLSDGREFSRSEFRQRKQRKRT